MKLRIQWVLLAMGAILAQGQAIAGSGPDSSDPTNPFSFNVFTIGNDTQSNVDDQGRVAVGGNLSSTGLSVGTSLSGSKTNNLIVGGNYSNQNNTVNGNVFIGGKATVSDPTVNGNFSADSVDFSGYGRINGNLTYASCYTNPNTTVTGRISK